MSVSKIWSMVAGMEKTRRGEAGERFTHQYMGQIAKELDAATGYSRDGGRGEMKFPSSGTPERLAHYKQVAKTWKDTTVEGPAGEFKLSINNQDGKALVAEVKLFPTAAGMTVQEFCYADGNPDFIRAYSGHDGIYTRPMAAGTYFMEVSKGSEYSIHQEIIKIEDGKETATEVSLYRFIDLAKAQWYTGDLHHHSVYSSPLFPPSGTDYVFDSVEEVAMSMQAKGLTFGALSDHHNVFNHREWETVKTEDFLPLLSKEISTTNGHILSLNVDDDVVYRIPEEKDRTDEYLRAEFVRTTDEIRAKGGFPQVNHPRDMQKAISFNPEFTDMIEVFDTIEIWNGSHAMADGTTNDEAFALWLSLLEEGRFLAATTGSDTHDIGLKTWMDSFGYVLGLFGTVKEQYESLPKELKEKAEYFLSMLEPQLEKLQVWEKINLTSGCVRTCVHAVGERTPKNLLENNKAGHSFVTNGPIVMAELNGAGHGDTVCVSDEETELLAKLTILSNRPLSELMVYQRGGLVKKYTLSPVEAVNGCYDYSREIPVEAQKDGWVFFRVQKDYNVQAITNPIFMK